MRKTALEKSLSKLNEEKERSNRELDLIKWQHQEISEANLIDNEDDELFSEYTKLAHSQELSVKIQELQNLLTNESNSLAYIQKSLDGLIDKEQQLNTPLDNLDTALTHVQEASFFFSHYLDELSVDTSRLDFLEKRLSLIDKLKKKYGSTLAEIKILEEQLAEKLSSFESIDQKIADKTIELSKATNEWQTASANLRLKRMAAGKSFGVGVTRQLQALNMIGAIFTVHLEKTAPTLTVEDLISFYLSANTGEKLCPLRINQVEESSPA